jgi:hypothetical protein
MRQRTVVTAQRSQECDRRVPSQPSRCQNAPAERQHSPAVARMRPRSGNTAQQVPERVRRSSVRPGRFQTRPQVVDAGQQVRERGPRSGIRNDAVMNRLAAPSQQFPLIFPCCDPLRRQRRSNGVLVRSKGAAKGIGHLSESNQGRDTPKKKGRPCGRPFESY